MTQTTATIHDLAREQHEMDEAEAKAKAQREADEQNAKNEQRRAALRATLSKIIPGLLTTADVDFQTVPDKSGDWDNAVAIIRLDDNREAYVETTGHADRLSVGGRISGIRVGYDTQFWDSGNDAAGAILRKIYETITAEPPKPAAPPTPPAPRIDDGGNAFPEGQDDSSGITVRDYFAAKAMQGFSILPPNVTLNAVKCAEDAYALADAMLKARSSQR